MRNIYVCLVHEDEACIVDLVHNLRTLDPASGVLLYNGGSTPALLDGFPFARYDAVVVPHPRRMTWGRLHRFAVDCMRFALDNFTFDTLTIVDSDQLALRGGYSYFLRSFCSAHSGVGMYVSDPRPQTGNAVSGPANAMLNELELWLPLFRSFGGHADAVRWTFWPATVFTSSCAGDLADVMKTNRRLAEIMNRTAVWATEEVVFPTLANLLGYELAENPSNPAYVRYGDAFATADLGNALAMPDAYWMHPVARVYDDPLRTAIRTHTHSGRYRPLVPEAPLHQTGGDAEAIEIAMTAMRPVPGWLDEREAAALLESAATVLADPALPARIVEIGSCVGRSTIALGRLLAHLRPAGQLFAIDPHRGVVGSLDAGIEEIGDTRESFLSNLESAGLRTTVTPIIASTADVHWQWPIAVLFVDGLHDYPNVARDGLAGEHAIADGGIAVFHDYAPHYPGVVTFVQELINTGRFSVMAHEGSLVALQKHRRPHPGSAEEARRGGDMSAGAPAVRRTPPVVSCVMPTSDRPGWVRRALRCFERQDVGEKELVVVDSGEHDIAAMFSGRRDVRYVRVTERLTLGELRNAACEAARGEVIMHWDDDDWSAYWRLRYQLDEMAAVPEARICGLASVIFSNPDYSRAWQYSYPFATRPWIAGGTLCYQKSFWRTHAFPDVNEGEDTHFVWTADPQSLLACEVNTFYVASVHPGNTSAKTVEGPLWRHYPVERVKTLLRNG
jgi:hypothetical protein